MICERCRRQEASIHWTELFDGAIAERHLCEDCRPLEVPYEVPSDHILQFLCRCDRLVRWRLPAEVCEHGIDAFRRDGTMQVGIEPCECGMEFIAIIPGWRCNVCGAETAVQPRVTGRGGYLHDHLYGAPEAVKVEIRGMLP